MAKRTKLNIDARPIFLVGLGFIFLVFFIGVFSVVFAGHIAPALQSPTPTTAIAGVNSPATCPTPVLKHVGESETTLNSRLTLVSVKSYDAITQTPASLNAPSSVKHTPSLHALFRLTNTGPETVVIGDVSTYSPLLTYVQVIPSDVNLGIAYAPAPFSKGRDASLYGGLQVKSMSPGQSTELFYDVLDGNEVTLAFAYDYSTNKPCRISGWALR